MWNRRRLHLATATCVLGALAGASALAEDWTQYRGPNRDGVSSEEILAWPPTEHWSASIGEGYSSVAVSGGRLYAMGHVPDAGGSPAGVDTVYCLDVETGSTIWSYSYTALSKRGNFSGSATGLDPDADEFGPRATPLVDGDRLYTISVDGNLYCLDARTGAVRWYARGSNHFAAELSTYGVCSSVLLHDDLLIADIGPKIVAVDKMTGALEWEQPVASTVFASVSPQLATLDGRRAIIFGEFTVTALDAETGISLWERPLDRSAISTHVVSGNLLFYSTYPNTGSCGAIRMTEHGSIVEWEGVAGSDNMVRTYHPQNVLLDGHLYVMDNSDTEFDGTDNDKSSFKCIDIATGAWSWTETSMGWANPIAVGDELLVLKQNGDLLRVDATPSAYTQTGSYSAVGPICWTYPVVSNGRVYVRNYYGELKCLFIAPSVSVEAIDAQALETSDTATFRIARTSPVPASPTATPLDVTLTMGGTGVRDTHYALAGGGITAGATTCTVTIPGGAASVDVTVTPLSSADAQNRTVSLTVERVAGSYVADARSSATAIVFDAATAVPVVSIEALGAEHNVLEGLPDHGGFTITRTGSVAEPLVVDVSLGGSAASTDYVLGGSDGATVTIPAGVASVSVDVEPVDNTAPDGDRDVTLTLSDVSAFFTRDPTWFTATVTIVDDDDAFIDAGDGDGLDDGWEYSYFGDITTTDGTRDSDGDGLADADEFALSCDPTNPDTDHDGASDGLEDELGTDPTWDAWGPVVYEPAPVIAGGTGCGASGEPSAGAMATLWLVVAAFLAGARNRHADCTRG